MLSRRLESVAQYSLDSESLFCFYEPKVPTQLKRIQEEVYQNVAGRRTR